MTNEIKVSITAQDPDAVELRQMLKHAGMSLPCSACFKDPCICKAEMPCEPCEEPEEETQTTVYDPELPEQSIGDALADLAKFVGVQHVSESMLTEISNVKTPVLDALHRLGALMIQKSEEASAQHKSEWGGENNRALIELNNMARVGEMLTDLGEPFATPIERFSREDLHYVAEKLKVPYEKFMRIIGIREGLEMRPYQEENDLEPMSKKQVMGDQPLVNNTGDNSMIDPEHLKKKLSVKTIKEARSTDAIRNEIKKIEEKIDEIVDGGGKVSLSDPLSRKLEKLRRELRTASPKRSNSMMMGEASVKTIKEAKIKYHPGTHRTTEELTQIWKKFLKSEPTSEQLTALGENLNIGMNAQFAVQSAICPDEPIQEATTEAAKEEHTYKQGYDAGFDGKKLDSYGSYSYLKGHKDGVEDARIEKEKNKNTKTIKESRKLIKQTTLASGKRPITRWKEDGEYVLETSSGNNRKCGTDREEAIKKFAKEVRQMDDKPNVKTIKEALDDIERLEEDGLPGYDAWLEEPYERQAENGEKVDAAIEEAQDNFDMQDFLEHSGEDLLWPEHDHENVAPEDLTFSTKELLSMVKYYLGHWITRHTDLEDFDTGNIRVQEIRGLMNEKVIPFLKEAGYTINADLQHVVEGEEEDKSEDGEKNGDEAEPEEKDNDEDKEETEDNEEDKSEDEPEEKDDSEDKADSEEPVKPETAKPAAVPAAVPAAATPAAVAATPPAPATATGRTSTDTAHNKTNTETGGSSPGGASTGGVGSGIGGAGTGGAATGGASTGGAGTVNVTISGNSGTGSNEGGKDGENKGKSKGEAEGKPITINISNVGGTTDAGDVASGDGPGSAGEGGSGKGSGGGGGGASPDEPNNYSTSRKDTANKKNDVNGSSDAKPMKKMPADLKEMNQWHALAVLEQLCEDEKCKDCGHAPCVCDELGDICSKCKSVPCKCRSSKKDVKENKDPRDPKEKARREKWTKNRIDRMNKALDKDAKKVQEGKTKRHSDDEDMSWAEKRADKRREKEKSKDMNEALYAGGPKIKKEANGNLTFYVADEETKEELRELLASDQNWDAKWADAIEHLVANGHLEHVLPEEIGALTDAPIVTDEKVTDDHGNVLHIGKIWWYPNYMASDPLEELLEHGSVTFTLGVGPNGLVEAQEMNECFTYGEPVVIVGDRHHLGDTGVVVSFDKVADTVVVDLHDHGKHSFPVSHVQHHDPLDNREQEDWYDMSNELMEPHRDPLELANDLEPEVDMDDSVGDASVDKIIAYEQGDLSEEDTIALFQELINSGLAWKLQGHYGRTAKQLIDDGYCTMPGKEVDEDNAHDDLRADPSDHDTLMHKNIADAGHEGILDEVDEISLGATGEDKVLTARIIKLDDKNYIEALRTIFPGKDLYKPHDKGDIMVAVDAAKPEARASLKAFLDKHDAAMREAAEPVDEPKELEEKAPPGMESWVKANKAQFKKEYGKKKGTEMLYKTAWSKYNESVEHLSNKLEEEYKKYTVDDARKAGYNLEPLYCKHCGSDEVTYHQGTDSARCQECGKDQDEPVKRK